jgi:hypothetical protein
LQHPAAQKVPADAAISQKFFSSLFAAFFYREEGAEGSGKGQEAHLAISMRSPV